MRIAIGLLALNCLFHLSTRTQAIEQEAPAAAQSKPMLTIRGEVEHPISLGAKDWEELPRQSVRAKDHGGQESTFEGVALVEVLKKAGVPLGDRLRGEAITTYVVLDATDGYRAVYSLAELDPAFTDRVVLLADRRDGKPMPPPEGPLRIVIPDEKRHPRWIRRVIGITVRRDRDEAPAAKPEGAR